MTSKSNSTLVRGLELRRLRKQTFKSAEAFAAACESVSVPTIYRAERGGPILKTYLNRMAEELKVTADRLMIPDIDGRDVMRVDLNGDWFGLFLSTDRFGHPCVIGEDAHLIQIDDRVEGRMHYRENNEAMVDVFENAVFKDNVLCGQLRSEKWTYPLECGAFVLSGGRDLTWLDGYLSWFDLDSEQTQFSKYILIRKDSESFEADLKNAHRLMNDESKLLRTRRFLESGYNFATSLTLVTASETGADSAADIPVSRHLQKPDQPAPALPPNHAVVALASLTVPEDNSTQTFFADGLVDDVATELVRMPDIDVLPRGAFPKDTPVTVESAAGQGATHILSGSMHRTDDRLKVNTQLVDTTTGRIVWAERYNHAAGTAFAMYDTIANDIARGLRKERIVCELPALADTTDPHAYELFLKGRSLYLRGMYTHAMRAAEALLIRAIEIDPKFARAHAQLSICRSYLTLSTQNSCTAPETTGGLSEAQTALKIHPGLPLGNAALGLAHYAAGQYQTAEAALCAAIGQDPLLFEPQFFLARNCRLQGDRSGAVKRFELAARLRPDDFRTIGLLAEELKALGRSQDADKALRETLRLIEKELEDHPDNAGALAFGTAVLAHLGLMDRALIWAEWALAIAPNDCLIHYNIARMYAVSGARRTALDHLQRAFMVPPIVQRRLALWMQYDDDFQLLSDETIFQDLQGAARETILSK